MAVAESLGSQAASARPASPIEAEHPRLAALAFLRAW
jgi:hypothetical protein